MSIVSRQVELGKALFQINVNTLRGYAELQRDNIERYFELNKEFGERLPEVKDLGAFFELQRDYNESLWNGMRSAVRSQTDLVKEAFQETGQALKSAYQGSTDDAEEVAAKEPKTTKAPKAKAEEA